MNKAYDIQDIILLKAINRISVNKLKLDLNWVSSDVIDSEIEYFKKAGFLKLERGSIMITKEGLKKLENGGLGIFRNVSAEDIKKPELIKFQKMKHGMRDPETDLKS